MITSNLIAIGLASVYFIAVFSQPEVKTVVNDTDEKNVDSFCVGIYFRTIYCIVYKNKLFNFLDIHFFF